MRTRDARLARRASEGDQRAFAAIFRRYHEDLHRYCLAILGNHEDAQDALQNTMLKALRHLPGESRRIELKPWLYRIAHNESVDLMRRRRPRDPLDPELAATGPGLAREAEARERLGRLVADLAELPERQRGALLMRELGGLGFEQIGAALGCSAAVARQTTYEARLGLRQFEAGREMDCVAVTKTLSDADGRVARRRDLRAHLRDCPSCAAFETGIRARKRDLAALSPLPATLAPGLLQGALGGAGAGGAGPGGIEGALGVAAAKSAIGSVALKATATVAVVGALGAGAERGGVFDFRLPGDAGKPGGRCRGDGWRRRRSGGQRSGARARRPGQSRRGGGCRQGSRGWSGSRRGARGRARRGPGRNASRASAGAAERSRRGRPFGPSRRFSAWPADGGLPPECHPWPDRRAEIQARALRDFRAAAPPGQASFEADQAGEPEDGEGPAGRPGRRRQIRRERSKSGDRRRPCQRAIRAGGRIGHAGCLPRP